jgi:signal transduction histidine kinase
MRSWPRLHFSLRAKLAVALAAAALLPLVLVSAVWIQVSLGRQERGLMEQTRQTAEIALNLFLRHVQRVSQEASRLAADPELHELLRVDPGLAAHYLHSYTASTEADVVEVVLPDHAVVARLVSHSRDDAQPAHRKNDPVVERALDYEHYLTLSQINGRLVVRASAPIVDAKFVLRGAVVMTETLDEHMADYIKSVVPADIGFLSGTRADASTLVDDTGRRLPGMAPPAALGQRVLEGQTTAAVVQSAAGKTFSVAYVPLQTVEGQRIGMMSVAVSRDAFMRARASAVRSLAVGAVGGLLFSLVLAYLIGRRITIPLHRLHQSAQSVATGDLDHDVVVETDDEIGDLARAFRTMTGAVREHREGLAARVREILTLHQIGRAVSSVLSLDEVLRIVVTEVASVLGVERGALLLADPDGTLHLRAEVALPRVGGEAVLPPTWSDMARGVLDRHAAMVLATELAVPLETRERAVGALVMARRERGGPFSEADLRLVVTFADQAATAIENARLYAETRAFSAELEGEVLRRTRELLSTNEELARTLNDLRDAQTLLVQQERMASLGLLVAGIAHEINTPAGAIQGSAQTLGETLERLVLRVREFVECGLPKEEASQIFNQMGTAWRSLSGAGLMPATEMRRRARDLAEVLASAAGITDPKRVAKRLVEAGADDMAQTVVRVADRAPPDLVVGIVEDLAFLQRASQSIRIAISSLVRLVRALKSYAHTDQEAVVEVDITEGLETTLTILHYMLRYGITVNRVYAPLPAVPVYMDELNQVWTNIIHNAVQAMDGRGELTLETFPGEGEVGVRIIDGGPGISPEVMPRIFEPFFTTKPAGEGTGLGLNIAKKIVEKHGGRVTVESAPGRTAFTVYLPLQGPASETRRGRDAAT